MQVKIVLSSIALVCYAQQGSAQNESTGLRISTVAIGDRADAYLSPGESQVCVSKCATYKAGASASSRLVCQYQASGVGSLEENADGVSCFPVYNCREDWNLCVPQEIVSNGKSVPEALGALSNISDTKALLAACGEISSLVQGGNSADSQPTGGWVPTSLGWHKGTGNVGCGWGSTYGHLGIANSKTLAEMGRVEISGFSGSNAERDCCVEAMKYEGTPMAEGGAAVRFDVYGETCRIDRALMMRGNLDASSGKAMDRLAACGTESYFWRHASGAADAANLQNAGRCVAANNFTRVRQAMSAGQGDATRPVGQLPGFEAELPNHPDQRTTRAVVYNTINTAEQCCEACAALRWVGQGNGSETNPCVAFQIVDGRCRVLRLEWFDRYATPNRGINALGNRAMGVTEVVAHCAGFGDHDTCARADNSHGWWGSCTGAECDYFSHMYYRDPGCLGCTYFPNATTGHNATYHKILPVPPNTTGGITLVPTGVNVTYNVTVVRDRTEEQIGGVVTGEGAGTSAELIEDGSWETAGDLCARIAVYESDAVVADADGTSTLAGEDLPAAIATSEVVCVSKNLNDTAGGPVTVNLGTVGLVVNASTHPDVFGEEGEGAGRRGGAGQGVVVSFECVGPGRDLCDFHSGSLLISQREVLAATDDSPSDSEELDGDGGGGGGGGGEGEGPGLTPTTTPSLNEAGPGVGLRAGWLWATLLAAGVSVAASYR